MKLLWELVRKDLRIFIADRRSAMISFAMPTVLACFIAFLMSNSTGQGKKVEIYLVDNDRSNFSKLLLDKMSSGQMFKVTTSDEAVARKKVAAGDIPLALVIPTGFGEAAEKAMSAHTAPPAYTLVTDPSRNVEVAMAKGSLMSVTMQTLSKEVYGDLAPTDEQNMPFKIDQKEQARDEAVGWSMSAHAFAGMAIQGLLFWAIESAMTILRERRMGLWRRQRASPVTPWMFLAGKAISAMIRALAILTVVFGFGMAVFHFRINPSLESYAGFGLIAIVVSLMTATFGLFVAALGKNENQSRGLSILAVLGMCMLGGAWFPMFLMPAFMQTMSKFVPISWAINGFDDMTWRGGDISGLLPGIAVMLVFSAVFMVFALKRIKWEPEPG